MTDKQWSLIVVRALGDPVFKRRLLANPAGVLKESGVTVPGGVTVKVVENSANVVYLTLPPAVEILEEDLEMVAAR